jgi:Fe-S-cluster-containing hydrogenase component 2
MTTQGLTGAVKSLIIKLEECTACRACELACSFNHEKVFAPHLSRIGVVRFVGQGNSVPVVCMHCASPACVAACPTGAAHLDLNARMVHINDDDCIGCGECITACPLGAVKLHSERGIAFICDLCDGAPVCVDHCLYGALSFVLTQDGYQPERRQSAEGHARSELG